MSSTTRELLAPLTTTFIPPPDCTAYAGGDNKPSANIFFAAQSCSSGSPHDISSCWPPALVHRSSWPLAGYGFYSPGLICPSGYTSACTQLGPAGNSAATTSIGRSFNFQFPPIASETAIACCPTGMTCTSNGFGWQTCATTLTTGFISVGICSGTETTYNQISKVSIGTAQTAIFGPLIQIVYQSTDLSPTSVISQKASQTQTDAPVVTSGDSGLPNGAKIGLGVGIPLAVILLIAIAAVLFLRKRRRAGQRGPTDSEPQHEIGTGDKILPAQEKAIHPDTAVHEVSTPPKRNIELKGSQTPPMYELPNHPGQH